ncbi:MAG: hypothetical protein BWY99_01679 [Synergistetes bacterium ADurb.BinA166]|nr:MAG: hypothetical protein BWY99_01679 [Synergistetes bacterium ADurb.BinA166]
MMIRASEFLLVLEGRARQVLWNASDGDAERKLIWARRGVTGVLPGPPPPPVAQNMTVASGKIWPADVSGREATPWTDAVHGKSIWVEEDITEIRSGMSSHRGPKGFVLETLILQRPDGAMTPRPVWVGDSLTLSK